MGERERESYCDTLLSLPLNISHQSPTHNTGLTSGKEGREEGREESREEEGRGERDRGERKRGET